MGYRGWRLCLCRIGWHTRREETLFTYMYGYCYKKLEDKP